MISLLPRDSHGPAVRVLVVYWMTLSQARR